VQFKITAKQYPSHPNTSINVFGQRFFDSDEDEDFEKRIDHIAIDLGYMCNVGMSV